MKERPLLMSAPMALAVLEGRKSQTRRVMNPQPSEGFSPSACESYEPIVINKNGEQEPGGAIFGCCDLYGEDEGYKCPHGQPGERLWCKETYCHLTDPVSGIRTCYYKSTDEPPALCDDEGFGLYRKDGSERSPWRSSIYMPRWASRLTLEIISVRVERVTEISNADAFSEGIESEVWDQSLSCRDYSKPDAWFNNWGVENNAHLTYVESDQIGIASFRTLWDSINAKRGFGWETGCWCWVIEFRRIPQP